MIVHHDVPCVHVQVFSSARVIIQHTLLQKCNVCYNHGMKANRKLYINEVTVSGIKAITKPLTITFAKLGTSDEEALKRHNTTAIYGSNSAGKSSFIMALFLYKRLLMHEWARSFDDLVNEETESSLISLSYTVCTETDAEERALLFYKHTLRIGKKNPTSGYGIVEESLEELVGGLKGELVPILAAKDGEITFLMEDIPYPDQIKKEAMNLCYRASALQFVWDVVAVQNKHPNQNWMFACSPVAYLDVVLNETDMRPFFDADNRWGIGTKYVNQAMGLISIDYETKDIQVPKEDAARFEESVRRKTDLLRHFDPKLRSVVAIQESEAKDTYVYSIYLQYDGYRVSADMASTGAKKILALADALNDANRGCVVFVDEFDAGINDVLFARLVEFFAKYGRGQLVFTTHNLEPMNVLGERAKSVVFITDDGKVNYWTKRGNASVVKTYRHGLIEGVPFNVEAEDFLDVFWDSKQ